MKLETYLDKKRISPTEFGRMLGLKSRASVSRYINGDRKPSEVVMAKIKELTGGKVTADSFYTNH